MRERVIGQHASHAYLPEERFQISAKTVKYRDKVFLVSPRVHFLVKSLKSFFVLVMKKTDRDRDEISELLFQMVDGLLLR